VVFSLTLHKRGKILKGWKPRHFKLKSDGSCVYYIKEEDANPKGAVVLEGYFVEAEPKSEESGGREHCFLLKSNEEGCPHKLLSAATKEEKAAAIIAFGQATRIATGYVNPDPVAGGAYKKAYAALRTEYGMYSKNPRGKEEHSLSDVLFERLCDALVNDMVKDLEGTIKHAALKIVKTLASGLVTVAWKGLEEVTFKLRPKVEEVLKKAMKPFLDAQDKLKEKIQEQVGERFINPAVTKVLSPFFAGVVSIVYPVIAHAYVKELDLAIEAVEKATPELKEESAAQVFRELGKTFKITAATENLPSKKAELWLGRVEEVLKIVAKLDDVGGLATKIREFIEGTIKPTLEIIYPPSIEADMNKFRLNTVYTFQQSFGESKDAASSGTSTISKLEHDLRYSLTSVVQGSIQQFVGKPYNDYVVTPVTSLLSFFI